MLKYADSSPIHKQHLLSLAHHSFLVGSCLDLFGYLGDTVNYLEAVHATRLAPLRPACDQHAAQRHQHIPSSAIIPWAEHRSCLAIPHLQRLRWAIGQPLIMMIDITPASSNVFRGDLNFYRLQNTVKAYCTQVVQRSVCTRHGLQAPQETKLHMATSRLARIEQC